MVRKLGFACRLRLEVEREEAIVSVFNRHALADVLGVSAIRMLLSLSPCASLGQAARLKSYYEAYTPEDLPLIERVLGLPITIIGEQGQTRLEHRPLTLFSSNKRLSLLYKGGA